MGQGSFFYKMQYQLSLFIARDHSKSGTKYVHSFSQTLLTTLHIGWHGRLLLNSNKIDLLSNCKESGRIICFLMDPDDPRICNTWNYWTDTDLFLNKYWWLILWEFYPQASSNFNYGAESILDASRELEKRVRTVWLLDRLVNPVCLGK